MSDREVSIYSREISKENTHQGVDAWRSDIKVGSKIDCYDSTGFWYASTVIGLEEREFQKEYIKMGQIAFRVSHPDGDKKDSEGNAFFGWDKEYDEWIPLYSARLASFQTHTQDCYDNQTTTAQNDIKKVAQTETQVDDQMDLLVKNENIFAVQRKQCRSDLLVDFINTIGQH